MTFATWELALLLTLIAATSALFLKDLAPKVAKIRAGAPDRPRTDRIGRRLAVTFAEVVFQTRVIGGRKVAGFLHALVFLGFGVFAFETTDHFLEPFGVHFLTTLWGPALPAFRGLLLVTSVAVSIGILGLAYRRFAMPAISPDPKSYSSGLVALMIFVLMLTYINGAAAEPWFEKVNWWLHSLLILAFPPLILRSKHFHILMSPFDIFLRTHRLGELKALDLDMESLEGEEEVSLGLETVADLPWKMRMDFLTCVECKRCTEQCPAWNCEQELNPRAFILDGRKTLDLEPGEAVIGNVISETALGQCTTCGACENICPVGIEHLNLLIGAKRAQALSTGKGLVAADFFEKTERYGNPFGVPANTREKLLDELGIPIYEPGKTDYLLWLGCVWTYNDDARSSLVATLKVLDHAGVSYGVLQQEGCSGHHSRRQGEELQFQTLARENIDRLRENRVAKMVAPCPHCLHTFRREYPTLDEEFEVEALHHSELMTDLLDSGRIKLAKANGANGVNGGAKVLTFHDPCYLGRFEKQYDAPRRLIRDTGHQLVELGRRRERSFCCGGGGGGFTRQTEQKRRVDQERKEEIAASGADTLITACPECKMMLDAAVRETKDLGELIADSLAENPS